ncbi:hypothetical protein pthi1_p05 [Paracoccus phage vB_PthS_Pthi1]|uniref:Uncharacterized protein n=1 Tax=Paracoccus thiocyanatus TaxID=34006 RepID=A0A1N6SH95_9RHOB|nr:hypothetical protein [Paracoccus thiocyanatus]AZV00370.1 hypothetical protein pthi1_p05 [Paracoccus phage vB_PthS_Pthi1]SIQ40515.1 hypothetical protein SAMN05421641_107112 [Paracoccus thiocyanatus]
MTGDIVSVEIGRSTWQGQAKEAPVLAALTPAPQDPWPTKGNVQEVAESGDGFWRPCSGCHESNEGYPTGPYHPVLKCHVGLGCSECGGIGAIWDTTDYGAMGDWLAKELVNEVDQQPAQEAVPVDLSHGWLIHKAGRGWFLPKAKGYTGCIAEAGRYSREDALSYSHPNDWDGPRDNITIKHESEIAHPPQPSETGAEPRVICLPYPMDGYGVCVGGRYDGWLMWQHPDGQWLSKSKLDADDPAKGLHAALRALKGRSHNG